MTSPTPFRTEISRLWSVAQSQGHNSFTVADALGVQQRTLALWVAGYEQPDEAEQRRAIQAVRDFLGIGEAGSTPKPTTG